MRTISRRAGTTSEKSVRVADTQYTAPMHAFPPFAEAGADERTENMGMTRTAAGGPCQGDTTAKRSDITLLSFSSFWTSRTIACAGDEQARVSLNPV